MNDDAARLRETAVVIPTVPGRAEALARCQHSVRAQTHHPAEVVVVEGQSVVGAIATGIARTSAPWIAFIDDDAVADPTWLEVLARHFDDPTVGAVGGRILHYENGALRARRYRRGPVARLSWFGRTTSRLLDTPDRHIVEDVDFLQGSNMCFRREALPQIDKALDEGMAPGYELFLCLAARRAGWRIVFDSDAVVSHFPAPRPAHVDRGDERRRAYEYSYVLTYALTRNLSLPRKITFLAYFLVLGQRASPGLVRGIAFVFDQHKRSRLSAAWSGKIDGLMRAARVDRSR